MTANRRWVLAKRPQGVPRADDFKLDETTLPDIQDGQALIRVEHISVDPGMRSRLSGDSYAPALGLGETIESAGVGKVLASRNAKFKEGAHVWGGFGWQSHFVTDGKGVQALDPEIYKGAIKPTAAIGVFGIPGLTAFFGLFEIGKPKDGNVVVISSAAGTVGATAGQIAKMQGCTTIGIAGSDAKCAYLKEIGFDTAINYKTAGPLAAAFKQAAPKGIDIYFDNVGAETLDAAIVNMRKNGRIVVSGQIAEYNTGEPRGIRHTLPFITQRLKMEGLVVYDYGVQFNEARAQMADWVRQGKLTYREEIIEGLEQAPKAFIDVEHDELAGDAAIEAVGDEQQRFRVAGAVDEPLRRQGRRNVTLPWLQAVPIGGRRQVQDHDELSAAAFGVGAGRRSLTATPAPATARTVQPSLMLPGRARTGRRNVSPRSPLSAHSNIRRG